MAASFAHSADALDGHACMSMTECFLPKISKSAEFQSAVAGEQGVHNPDRVFCIGLLFIVPAFSQAAGNMAEKSSQLTAVLPSCPSEHKFVQQWKSLHAQ